MASGRRMGQARIAFPGAKGLSAYRPHRQTSFKTRRKKQMAPKELEAKQLHEGPFLTILWDTPRRIIGIRWKPATAKMTEEDFKGALTLFADHVERMSAHAIHV